MIIGDFMQVTPKSPILHSSCPCCHKNVNDPMHVSIGKFFLVFSDAERVGKAEGRIGIELRPTEKRPVMVVDPRTMHLVNVIHHHLKLDGLEGRQRVDFIEDLLEVVGWTKIKLGKIKEFFQIFGKFQGLFSMVNEGNPTFTEEMQIDLIPLLAVIRDSEWKFYRELENIALSTLFDAKGHMKKLTHPTFTRPIFVGGGSSGALSFPTYFARNEAQLQTYQIPSWSDYFLFLGDSGKVGLFILCLDPLAKDNHFWADLLWETHKRLNLLVPSQTPKEIECKLCGAPLRIDARFCNKCGQKI